MEIRDLPLPAGYDPGTQRLVGTFAAHLKDQTRLLKKNLEGFETHHLEWQPHTGVNTVGMLLAHIAVAETYWLNIAARQIQLVPEGDDLILATIGLRMDDDGMPLKPEAAHPETLKGKTLSDYIVLLDKARAATHKVLMGWTDADLEKSITTKRYTISYLWMVYHVVEHQSGHYGQILLLRHMLRREGLLPMPVEQH